MSAPRTLARYLFVLTTALLAADLLLLLVFDVGSGPLVLFGGSLGVHAALGAAWRRRARGQLRSAARRTVWPVAAVLYGAAALAAILSGGGVVGLIGGSLNMVALVLVAAGSVAERRRAGERLRFVLHAG